MNKELNTKKSENSLKNACHLCGLSIADKTNSHIIPSFLVCSATSSDGSGKRNHELIYSIGKTIKVYFGNEVSQKILGENFDNISDERIENEFRLNNVSRDYIFCSSCEKALGDYLESPYSNYYKYGKKIQAHVQYYFWLSVLWRVSQFETHIHHLPKFINAEIRNSLYTYMQHRISNDGIIQVNQKFPIHYKIIRCDGFSKNGNGFILADYDKNTQIFSLVIGDVIICFSYNHDNIPLEYNFLNLGEYFRKAPLNDGTKPEEIFCVDKDVFDIAYNQAIKILVPYYLKNEKNTILKLWEAISLKSTCLPKHPSNEFIKKCIEYNHSENVKVGERCTPDNYAHSFASALHDVYGITVTNNVQ